MLNGAEGAKPASYWSLVPHPVATTAPFSLLKAGAAHPLLSYSAEKRL